MSFEPTQIVLGFALALAVGGLVGLERERHAYADKHPSFGGVRTFPLVALLGALSALLVASLGVVVLVAAFAAVTVLLALGYVSSRTGSGDVQLGLTSEFAALLVFVLGALPFLEVPGLDFPRRLLLSGALGTVVMSLLALRRPIHAFAEQLSHEDVLAAVRFALVAVVALPLLPDRAYGPYGALNPFRIGVVVVLIAGISFVGYVAVRLFGARRGIGVTGLAGGLVSSTAVTLTFAAKGKEHARLAPAATLAIALAATIMFARVAVEILAIQPALLPPAAASLGSMLAVGAAGCYVLWRRAAHVPADGEATELQNPFRLRQALRLGVVYALIRLVAAIAWRQFGQSGLLVSAAASGLADVDAITVSVARMHAEGLDTGLAVGAVIVAVVTNTLVKVGLALGLGGRRVGLGVALVLVPAGAVGALVAFLVKTQA